MAKKEQFAALADLIDQELAKAPKESREGVGGSIFEHVAELVAALRAGDPMGITRAVRNVLNHILGDEGHPAVGSVGAFSWLALARIIAQILPLLFDGKA